jgi:hypothetical protein
MKKKGLVFGILSIVPLAFLSSCQGVSSEGKEAFAFAEALNKGFSPDVPFGLLEKDPEIPEESWDSKTDSGADPVYTQYQSKTYPADQSQGYLTFNCEAFPIAEEKLTGSYVTSISWNAESDSTFFGCSISSTPEEVVSALRANFPTIERGGIEEPIGKVANGYAYFYHATLMKEFQSYYYRSQEGCQEEAEKRGALEFGFIFRQDESFNFWFARNYQQCHPITDPTV